MLKKVLTSKLFLVFVLIGLSILVFQLVKITEHKYKLKSELEPLNKEIEQIKQEKKELSESFDYFKSQSYAEKEARAKLNLKKEGEEVIIVSPQEGRGEEESLSADIEQLALNKDLENKNAAKKLPEEKNNNSSKVLVWWNYFFGN
jgi:cell division protein FtsB